MTTTSTTNKLILGFVFLSVTFLLSPGARGQTTCPQGMISYWTFDEGSGTVASDSVDANHGTLLAAPTWTTGQVGGALSFDGVDDWVSLPYSAINDLPCGTLELWIKRIGSQTSVRTHAASGNFYGHFLNKQHNFVDTYALFGFSDSTDSPRVKLSLYHGWFDTHGLIVSDASIQDGAWTHVAVTWDGYVMKLYINNFLDKERLSSYGIPNDPFPTYTSIGAGGHSDAPPVPSRFFRGSIDEVSIYNRALTELEICQHYHNGLAGYGYCYCEFADSDADGIGDECESVYGTDPLDPDTDGDGLLDGTEVEMAHGSGCPDPLDPDSDGDTLSDGEEVDLGTAPCDPDTDGDGFQDGWDPDPLNPGAPCDNLEQVIRDLANDISVMDLALFNGPNDNANAGRRNALANRAMAAANIASHCCAGEPGCSLNGAINSLESLLDKIDGDTPTPDWMYDSPEKTALAGEVSLLIGLLYES